MDYLVAEIDRLVKDDIYPKVQRLKDQPIPGSPTKALQQVWQVTMPTMKLKTIPQACGHDAITALKECEREFRSQLADPQYHHKP